MKTLMKRSAIWLLWALVPGLIILLIQLNLFFRFEQVVNKIDFEAFLGKHLLGMTENIAFSEQDNSGSRARLVKELPVELIPIDPELAKISNESKELSFVGYPATQNRNPVRKNSINCQNPGNGGCVTAFIPKGNGSRIIRNHNCNVSCGIYIDNVKSDINLF